MYFNERIETMPVNALRKIQSEKLVQQLQYMYRNQPFIKSYGMKKYQHKQNQKHSRYTAAAINNQR